MIQCLYPDCDYDAEVAIGADEPWRAEKLKRQIIDHINHDHDDAHVLIACAHELREVERWMAKTRNPKGEEIEVGEQIKSECVRCWQFVVEDYPRRNADGTFAPTLEKVTVTQDEPGGVFVISKADDGIEGTPA